MSGSGYPKFRNDRGVPEICIGVKEFKCIGASPPQDHPQIYINMREADTILCPYCATRFRFDPRLTPLDADPPDSKRQVVSVDPVKWAAIVEAGTRVGSARDDRKKRGLQSFRADIAC